MLREGNYCVRLFVAGVCLAMGLQAVRSDVLKIGTQKQLFVDDYVIESIEPGVISLMNQPLKYAGNPVLEMDRCWEADMHFANSTSVIYDKEEKLFKIWTETVNYNWSDTLLAYYVSNDGIHWEKPLTGQFDYHSPWCRGEPSRKHNFLRPGVHRPGVFKDPHENDPAKKYKTLYSPRAMRGQPRETRKGTWAAYSADGIHWKDYLAEVNPVFLSNDTHQVVFWDPHRDKYVTHIRLKPPLFKDNPRMWGRDRQEGVRTPGLATSDDFLHWNAPKDMRDPVEVNKEFILLAPDEDDTPATRGFYSLETLLYEGVYIGFPTPYHNYPLLDSNLPPTGGNARSPWIDTIDVQLAFSRDGKAWQRVGNRRPFIPNGPAGSYDAGMVYISQAPTVREDLCEIWIYYLGLRKGHGAVNRGENQEGAISLARLRLDGFVSLSAGKGAVTTKPLEFEGNRLRINASTAGDQGSVYVEILDPQKGQPLAGFARDDSDVFQGDRVRHTVTWRNEGDLSGLGGKSVRLRFHLERAKLFSFQFYKTD